MIQRHAIKFLDEWAKNSDRRPLVLRGARQVGKTTLVNEFALKYSVYLKLNLDKESHRKLFDNYEEIKDLIDAIYRINR